jgi:hypothetical protein
VQRFRSARDLGENSPSLSVATLNTTTGTATPGPGVTGTTSPFWGLAQVQSSATPEPASLGLVLCAGVAIIRLRLCEWTDKRLDFGVAVSPDGRYLLFSQDDYQGSNLLMMENFR